MSLNKFMHPRNRYKLARPDFEVLGQKYPEFKLHLVENAKGKPVLDFQNPEALRVLTVCMLKEDYGLDIELPPDRLVPTLPLRLNYVHWIEDITKDWNKQELRAIDIGTGACCVYPILAISSNTWRFLATEADEVNFASAVRNMERNKLTEKIKVTKVSPNTILEGVLGQTEETYDFCMCNPPFFADHMEAQGLVSRSPSRPDAKTMSTASPQEGIVQGGEVAFVRRLIEESNFLQDRVRVYTTMLGKKASLAPLKEILRRHKITNFASTEFCQGKTMRWGLAWTFDKSVVFPKSAFSQGKKEGKRSVVHIVPTQVGHRREPLYDLLLFFKQIFSELRIHCREGKQTQFFALLTLTAAENTWIHSRRKRRQLKREEEAKSATEMPKISSQSAAEIPTSTASRDGHTDSVTEMCERVKKENGSTKDDAVCEEVGDSVKKDSESTHSNSVTEKSDPAKNVTESAPSVKSIEEPSDHAEGQNGSADTCMEGVSTTGDTGQGPHTIETLPVQSVHVDDSRKRKLSLESPQSSASKRAKVEHPASILHTADHEENRDVKSQSADGESNDRKSQSEVPDSQAKPTESLSTEEKVSNEASGLDTSSEGNSVLPSESCAADAGSNEGGKGRERPPAHFVLKCHMSVRVQGSDLAVELTWLDGQDIQLMHQLMQVLKNRLAQRAVS